MELVCTQHFHSQVAVPMQAHCTKGVTKWGGNRVEVRNGVDIVNGDGLEREIQESNGDRSGN